MHAKAEHSIFRIFPAIQSLLAVTSGWDTG